MESETKQILENIRKKRMEKGIPYEKLALEAGIARSHMYYIESKRVIPTIDTLVRIAKGLNISLSELIDTAEVKQE
ncbi:MAG: helix-turn-helix domain-containing protein [Treponema sp.]|nr:helix-turn-helix domain-containing protein [Treponema sp.]